MQGKLVEVEAEYAASRIENEHLFRQVGVLSTYLEAMGKDLQDTEVGVRAEVRLRVAIKVGLTSSRLF